MIHSKGRGFTSQSFDANYVQRLKEGDMRVENHFALYFSNLLVVSLRAQLRSPQLVEDIQQETLLRVLDAVRNKGGVKCPERFGAFVHAVSRNVGREFIRSRCRHDAMSEYKEGPGDRTVDPDGPTANFDAKRQVQRVMDKLPEKDQALLRAVYLEVSTRRRFAAVTR